MVKLNTKLNTFLIYLALLPNLTQAAAPTSVNFPPPAVRQNKIITLEVNYLGGGVTITTNKKCPTGFSPYLVLTSSGTQTTPNTTSGSISSSDGLLLNGNKACINNFTTSATNYTVAIQAPTTFSAYNNISRSDLWVGTDKGAYTVWSSARMQDVSQIDYNGQVFTNNATSGSPGTLGLTLVTYCYPGNTAPPSNNC